MEALINIRASPNARSAVIPVPVDVDSLQIPIIEHYRPHIDLEVLPVLAIRPVSKRKLRARYPH